VVRVFRTQNLLENLQFGLRFWLVAVSRAAPAAGASAAAMPPFSLLLLLHPRSVLRANFLSESPFWERIPPCTASQAVSQLVPPHEQLERRNTLEKLNKRMKTWLFHPSCAGEQGHPFSFKPGKTSYFE